MFASAAASASAYVVTYVVAYVVAYVVTYVVTYASTRTGMHTYAHATRQLCCGVAVVLTWNWSKRARVKAWLSLCCFLTTSVIIALV